MALERLDYLEAALEVLAQQYRGRPNFRSLVEVFARQFQELEGAAQQLLTQRLPDGAVGEQLSVLERIVGQGVYLSADPVVRKAWIASRIRLNRSSGTGDDLLSVFRLVLEAPLVPELTERFPAGLDMRVAGGALPANLVAPLARMLQLGKAAGVGARMLYQLQGDSQTFRFADPLFPTAHLTAAASAGAATLTVGALYGPWPSGDLAALVDGGGPHEEQVSVTGYGGGTSMVVDGGTALAHDFGERVVLVDPLVVEDDGDGFGSSGDPTAGGHLAGVA